MHTCKREGRSKGPEARRPVLLLTERPDYSAFPESAVENESDTLSTCRWQRFRGGGGGSHAKYVGLYHEQQAAAAELSA